MVLFRLNDQIYKSVKKYFLELESATLTIQKVENIPKNDKTIDDLLDWNQRITEFIHGCSERVRRFEILCHDFKIFNPFVKFLLIISKPIIANIQIPNNNKNKNNINLLKSNFKTVI